MQQAVDLAPASPTSVRQLAIELRFAGRFEESVAMHKRSLELAPEHPNMLLHYSLTLEHFGAIDQALAVQEQLFAVSGGAAMYEPRLQALRGAVARVPRRPKRRKGQSRLSNAVWALLARL